MNSLSSVLIILRLTLVFFGEFNANLPCFPSTEAIMTGGRRGVGCKLEQHRHGRGGASVVRLEDACCCACLLQALQTPGLSNLAPGTDM